MKPQIIEEVKNPNMIRMANLDKIAIFMGYRYEPHNDWSGTWLELNDVPDQATAWIVAGTKDHESKTTLNYDTDWALLMEVWEKIAELRKGGESMTDGFPQINEMTIGNVGCLINANLGHGVYSKKTKFISFNIIGDQTSSNILPFNYDKNYKIEKLIDAVYVTILEFINWYNEYFLPFLKNTKKFDL